MKIIIPIVFLSSVCIPLQAATTSVNSFNFNVTTAIPDNDPVGLLDTQVISSPLTWITGLTVQISMQGGWAGDIYAYVTHASGFVVLFNRPGRSLLNPDGSGVNNLNVSFSDSAMTDIHTAIPSSGTILGMFQPDAREIDPADSLDTSPRTAFLSSFQGLDPNGSWSLYIADISPGDQMTLNSWSMNIEAVPEPSAATLLALGMIRFLSRRRARVVS